MSGPVRRRCGIYGGAFDPPHLAHVALAGAAIEQLALDELRIVPTGQAWHRATQPSDARHRLNMARLAFEPLDRVLVDDRETLRAGPSYTIDTLLELRAEQPDALWYLLIGEDQWRGFTGWRRGADILAAATVCVAGRPDAAAAADGQQAMAGAPVTIRLPAMPHSATEIRRRVAAGLGVDHLVPPAVARYIAEHQLYRPA